MSRPSASTRLTRSSAPLSSKHFHGKIKHFEEISITGQFTKVRRSTTSIKPDTVAQRWSHFESVNNQNKSSVNGVNANGCRTSCDDVKRYISNTEDVNRTECTQDKPSVLLPKPQLKRDIALQVPRYERRLPRSRTGIVPQARHTGLDFLRHETWSVIEKQSPRLNSSLLHPHWSVVGLPSSETSPDRTMESKRRLAKSRPQARSVLTQAHKKRAAADHKTNKKQVHKCEDYDEDDGVQMRHKTANQNEPLPDDENRNSVFDKLRVFDSIDKSPNTNSNRAVKNIDGEEEVGVVSNVDLNNGALENESQKVQNNGCRRYENHDFTEPEVGIPYIGPKPTIKPKNIKLQYKCQKKINRQLYPKKHNYEEVALFDHTSGDEMRGMDEDDKEDTGGKTGRKAHRERSVVIVGQDLNQMKITKDESTRSQSMVTPQYEEVYEGSDDDFEIVEPHTRVEKSNRTSHRSRPSVYEDVYEDVYEENKRFTFIPPSPTSKPLPPPKPRNQRNPPYFILERSGDNNLLQPPENRTRSSSNGDIEAPLFRFQSYKTPYVLADTNGMIGPPLSPESRLRRKNMYDRPSLLTQRSASAEDIFEQQRTTIVDGSGYSIPGSHLWRAHSFTEQGEEKTSKSQRPVIVVPLKDEDSSSTGKKHGKRGRLQTIQRKINNAFRRKENLKHARESTLSELDRSSLASEDSDGEINEVEHKKRLTEIRRKRSRSQYCSVDRIRHYARYEKLFDYVVVVTLKNNAEKHCFEPYEIRRYPSGAGGPDKLRAIPYFCFPDAFKWAPVEQYRSETFSFVLTSEDGSRSYGYCRRLLPPGEGPRLPEVYCIISPIGCFPLYEKLLDLMEDRRMITPVHVEVLLKAAIARKFPSPGMVVELRVPTFTGTEEHTLRRPLDSRLEQVDFEFLRTNLDNHMLIQMFASLLMERRIIMCSSDLEILSQCTQAAAALLYPFSWQHVYIPILPEKLIDMVCSPTPYIIGMLSIGIPKLDDLPLDEVLVIDLDSRDFHYVVGDESSIIPKKLYNALLRALAIVYSSTNILDSLEGLDQFSDEQDSETLNAALSEVFIRFFVETCGHYLNFMVHRPNGSYKFDRDGFLKAMPSKSIRKFLEVFTESQMFSLFIQEKEMSDEGLPQGLFEKKIREYETEMKNNVRFGAKVKNIGKFIKDSGHRINGMKTRIVASLEDRV